MLAHSFAQKTLIAAACSLFLVACGQKPESSPAAPQAELASPAAVAAAPAPLVRSQDNAGNSAMGKLSAKGSANHADAELAEPATAIVSAKTTSAIPQDAIAALPATSLVGVQGRKLVLTANAGFSVKNTYASALAIEDAVAANDGFVVANDIVSTELQEAVQSQGDGQRVRVAQVGITAKLVVRVPSSKAQIFLRDIAKQIESLDDRNFAANDVQFDMLRSQLEAARSQEAQADLGQLVRQPGYVIEKGAVIEARSQAKASRDEARVVQAQLADQVAFSTITLRLHQSPQVRITQEADFNAAVAANRPSFGAEVVHALTNGWRGLLQATVWALSLWPLWLLLVAAGGILVGYRSHKRSASLPK